MGTFKFDEIAFNSTEKKKPVDKDKYTYLGLEHLDSDSIYVTRYGADVAPKGDKLIMKKGDVLFGKRRAYQKKVAIAPFDGIFSAHGMVLRPKEDVIDKEFFPMFIKSDYFLDAAIKISVGSLSPTINWRDLKELEFELPSLEEQRKLAEVLWAIYDMKDKYKKLILATDELVKSQFIEMVNKSECEWKSLDDIASEWLKGQPLKKDDIKENGHKYCIHYGELFTKYDAVIHDVVSLTDVDAKKLSKSGDILFPSSDVTPNGLTRCSALMEGGVILGGDIIVLRPLSTYNSKYLTYAIRSQEEQLLSRVTGSLVRHISAKSLKTVIVPILLEDAQNHLIELERQSDKSKFALQEAIKDLDALSKKIIAENLIPAGKE